LSLRATLALAATLLVGIVAGLWLGARSDIVDRVEDAFGIGQSASDEAVGVIEDTYFKDVGAEQLENASIRGMIKELRERYDDRFSHYFDPEQLKDFNEATSGSFSGVGLGVREVKRGLRVTSVFDETPAKRAGIEQGDEIVAVNGKSIAGKPADLTTAQIKGPPGTSVEVRVVSASGRGARTVELERANVKVPAVTGEIRTVKGRKVAYVRLASFSSGVHGELRAEIERLYRRGAEGLVLDLRGNGGGLLNEAVLTSSVFVEDGVIVSTSGRAQPDQEYEAAGKAIESKPTVVLINGDTASAAEILAAALAEHDVATLAGTRSFGKGVFQEVIELDNGGALDLTVGEYLTSEGRSLAGKGIKPEIVAKDDLDTEADEGLQRALEAVGGELGQGR
jgi:carboxyl-terminal processing protease